MTGHSSQAPIHRVLWPDAELEQLIVDYEAVRITLLESSGATKEVLCNGYIGYRVVGFWDETVVESAEVREDSEFISECIAKLDRRLGHDWMDSGSPARNRRRFLELRITLGDGTLIEVIAAEFRVSELEATDPDPTDPDRG